VFTIVLYPIISDRVLRTREYHCEFVPDENPEFVKALAILGHHTPFAIVVTCSVVVCVEMKKLMRTRPSGGGVTRVAVRQSAGVGGRVLSVIEPSRLSNIGETSVPHLDTKEKTKNGNANVKPEAVIKVEDSLANNKEETAVTKLETNTSPFVKSEVVLTIGQPREVEGHGSKGEETQQPKSKKREMTREEKERRTFVTLAYIVTFYVICWVPFHIVYDMSYIRPSMVPDNAFTYTFWLTYVNSTVNPFLYAFTSYDLRQTIVKMLTSSLRKKRY